MAEGTVGVIFGSLPLWTEEFSGSGSGSGYGYGYGSGSGYGYGSGSGSGSGDGSGSGYWRLTFLAAVQRWSEVQRKRLGELSGAFLAFWKSDARGLPANGGRGMAPVAPGTVQKIKGPLKLCGVGALHATLRPDKWKG